MSVCVYMCVWDTVDRGVCVCVDKKQPHKEVLLTYLFVAQVMYDV